MTDLPGLYGNARSADDRNEAAVIVTGAAGFIGSHTVRALLGNGRRVIGTDTAPAIHPEILAGVSDAQLHYVVGDLRSPATVDRLLEAAGGPMDVVHLAAAKILPNDPDKALEGFSVSSMGSMSLCMRIRVGGMMRRFVHVSTQSVFGRRPPTTEPIAEEAALYPTGFYGFSKAAAEMGVLAIREAFQADLAAVRITGIFGWRKKPANTVDNVFDAAIRGEPLFMDAGRDDEYEMTYVKDTVRGILSVLDATNLSHPVYHVSRGRMTTLGELADILGELLPTARLEIGPGRSDARQRTALDVSRVALDCGFRTAWEIRDAASDFRGVRAVT
jgi:nucleoside-diphosphate-sugar epimerase